MFILVKLRRGDWGRGFFLSINISIRNYQISSVLIVQTRKEIPTGEPVIKRPPLSIPEPSEKIEPEAACLLRTVGMFDDRQISESDLESNFKLLPPSKWGSIGNGRNECISRWQRIR